MQVSPSLIKGYARRPRMLPIYLCAVALVLTSVLASGCGSEIVTYHDPVYGFSFDYNDSWDLIEIPTEELPTDTARSVGVFDPRGSDAGDDLTFDYMSVDVYEISPENLPQQENMTDEFAFYVAQLKASDDSLRIHDGPRAATVNGVSAVRVTYTYTANDTLVRCSEYRWLIDDRGYVYGLFLQASDDNWTRDSEMFDTFLDTFSLGADT